jgi:hypothetical protein
MEVQLKDSLLVGLKYTANVAAAATQCNKTGFRKSSKVDMLNK